MTVVFQEDGPEGIRGVACHSDFREVEGHAQGLCDGLPDGSMVIYTDENPDRRTLLDTLAHESWHLRNGVVDGDTPWERFQEEAAYRAGQEYADAH